jgi:hypothetical protein
MSTKKKGTELFSGLKNSSVPILFLMLAGCTGAPVVVESDAVIAGKRYADAPILLGAVQMRLLLREGAAPRDAARAPENLQLSLGFRARQERARVIVSGATLKYGAQGVAEVVTRHEALGSAQGCPVEGTSVLPLDYWFNATVDAQAWTCVTLALVTPGRLAGDALELRFEPVNVDGELVRALPVTFVKRAPPE